MTRQDCIRERHNRGLSISEAAAIMGLSHRSLRRFEDGHNLQPAYAKKVADFYGVRVTDIQPPDFDEAA